MFFDAELTLLLLLSTLYCITPFEFGDAEQIGVEFGENTSPQVITVAENDVPGRTNSVIVNGIQGTIGLYANSSNYDIFNPRVEEIDGETYISIENIDYEGVLLENNKFLLEVWDAVDVHQLVFVIKNLDDESPTLTTTNCTMKEKTEITVENSDCVFTVTDGDGWLGSMDFSKILDSAGADLFELKYKSTPPDDAYVAEVYLVLQDGKRLDYETATSYGVVIAATDAIGHPTTPANIEVIVQVEDVPD